ncbi:MAG TPA: TolC family protein [Acidobacteriaceae bacterium]|nr:TolC family protein [Acidobacteriaceae bacterium]
MHLFGNRVTSAGSNHLNLAPRHSSGTGRLRAAAVIALGLWTGMPPQLFAQQAAPPPSDKIFQDLPAAPTPTPTEPLHLRSLHQDYSKPYAPLKGNPINTYRPTKIASPSFMNSVRLGSLVKNGKIYLSLSDALALALENNYDIAIARYDLDIADTDILRSKAGGAGGLLGAPSGLVTNTIGGTSSTLTAGGGPGGTSVGSGGAGSGTSGLSLTTNGAGPAPESFDPVLGSTIQLDWATTQQTNVFNGGTSNTDSWNFTYNQGFAGGEAFQLVFDNTRATSSNANQAQYSPEYSPTFKATLTQHLAQGFGVFVNHRFIYQAINDRRITDSSFRQQILYTVNQVENIYWSLVSSYEDLQAKEHALEQSSQVAADNRKQLQIGTMAPLDVVTADSSVATDKQNLITSQSNLNYQQQVMKQAIARNLNDPILVNAPIIPTDRISLEELPEEKQPVDELVQTAFKQRPELEVAVLTLKNDQITLRGAKNALLPTIDVYGYYGGSGLGGVPNANCKTSFFGCPDSTGPEIGGYGTGLQNTFNNSSPDKGVGFTISVPIRNRLAQSVEARSQMEYRQAQLRLEQLYTQIRMQVVNAQFALTNDRSAVIAAEAAQTYNAQSLDAEQKKLHLGASTTANVLQQSRNLATAESNLTSARAAYAKDRAALYQLLASTLQHYGINMQDTAAGVVNSAPVVPGVAPAKPDKEPTVPTPEQQRQQEQSVPAAPTVPTAPQTNPQ